MLKTDLSKLSITHPGARMLAIAVIAICVFGLSYPPTAAGKDKKPGQEQYEPIEPPVQRLSDRAVVIYAAPAIQELIVVQTPQFRKVGRFTQVQAQVQNLAKFPLDLEYKVTWMDENGFEIGGAVAWNMLHLSPNDIQAFQSTGKHPDASQVKITVRYHTPT